MFSVPPLISNAVSAWIPSSPEAICTAPPSRLILPLAWSASSEESMLMFPPVMVTAVVALMPLALAVSSAVAD